MNREFFPTGHDRKNEIIKKNMATQELKDLGRKGILGEFQYLDSALDTYSKSEHGHDQPSFEGTFRSLLPKGETLKGYIEKTLEARKGKAIGVEFGGVGTELFSGFSPGFFKKSVGVTLVDHRSEFSKIKSHEEHKNSQIQKLNHEVLEGNILDLKTYIDLEKNLHGEKIDLIIERMAGGFRFIPQEPYALSKVLQNWYKLLNEEGIIFAEVHSTFRNLMEKWSELINNEYKGKLELQLEKKFIEDVFKFKKLVGAPKELPFLDPRIVANTRIYKWQDEELID